MVFLSDLFDESEFSDLHQQGYIRTQKHPRYPLQIAGYTEKAQFDRAWNDVTTQCRGLIYNTDTREVLARPWKKFFNWDEGAAGPIPNGPMIKSPKMDGSLGILYPIPDDDERLSTMAVASRGSFASEQATWATRWFLPTAMKHGFAPVEGCTYLFEIIYPENRIVVDYGDFEGLVLLDVLDIESGTPVWSEFDNCAWPHKVEKTSVPGGFSDSLVHEIKDDEEGFVLYFPAHDIRVKMKGSAYVALHRVLTQANARTVWEYLSTGKTVQDLLGDVSVPDEFYAWLRQTALTLKLKHDEIEGDCDTQFKWAMAKVGWERFDRDARKEFALLIKDFKYKSILFRMWDDQPYDDIIWKIIRPEATKPFWSSEE